MSAAPKKLTAPSPEDAASTTIRSATILLHIPDRRATLDPKTDALPEASAAVLEAMRDFRRGHAILSGALEGVFSYFESRGFSRAEIFRAFPEARAEIHAASNEWAWVVGRAARALMLTQDIYQRGNRLVDVLPGEVYGGRDRKLAMLQIRELPTPQIDLALDRACRFLQGKENKPVKPPPRLAAAIATMGTWEGARPLKGIVRTPTLRPDGSILQTPGYDHATGWLYQPSGDFPAVPDQPTQADATAALSQLLEPLVDFPFVSDVDRHAIVAALLTLIGRAAIEGATPAFTIDASTPGSGKGLLAQLVYLIATGDTLPMLTFPSGDEAELEKILGSLALAGAQIACWDNVKGQFGGAALEKVLTSTRPQLRVLGRSETPALDWTAITIATGNNLDIRADMLRRCIRARLEPDTERPAERTGFLIPDLKRWARENRAQLVVAALTLLRAYYVAGRPTVDCRAFGDYSEWRVIAQAIRWAGGPDVIAAQPTGEDDPEHEALAKLFAALAALGRGVSAAELILLGYDSIDAATGHVVPAKHPAIGQALNELCQRKDESGRPNSRSVGKALARAKGKVIGTLKLRAVPNPESGHTKNWMVSATKPHPFPGPV